MSEQLYWILVDNIPTSVCSIVFGAHGRTEYDTAREPG